MKKLLVAVVLLFGCSTIKAEETLLDQFYAGFVGNAKFVYEMTTDGVSKPEFLDNFFEIGKLDGDYIAAIDSGVGGTILPDTAEFSGAEWSTGAKLHLAPFIKSYVNLPEQWAFLRTLEIDARGSYNWTEHHPFWGLCLAYPFK